MTQDTPEQIADALRALESVGILAHSLAAGTRLACTRLAQLGDAESSDPNSSAFAEALEERRADLRQEVELRDAQTGAAAWRERYISARKRASALETERDELLVSLEVLRARSGRTAKSGGV